ncbi:VWA containing CoxE family protein [bacterium C-53]|nr:VWA containing CoxE family protein [Lachnospiraceae bacterium]NBI01959.1 VWA containing CoxE family protein [Lachnospiraceae bacterium]RKJ12358.1 VWA containing CoxE family protein [bacterium C-53]
MFSGFFYFLRQKGMDVTLSEWLTLVEALDKGLCNSSLTDFYYIARMILAKNETEYDKFDMAFDEYFKGIRSNDDDITDQMLRWLDKSELDDRWQQELEEKRSYLNKMEDHMDAEKIRDEYQEKKKQQDSEHNGGSTWIGTMGKTAFGNMGGNLGGIRIGGTTGYQSAFEVIGARKYRDFRNDRVLDNRQFQMALRRLRQFSTRLDIPEDEFSLDKTVDATCNNGGYLKIIYERPRKNTVKLLLLMDSGGTMIPYCDLLNDLFQSVHKSNHYKDVKTYYFHNCIYSHVYKTPECENGDWIETDWMFKNLDNNYKVIIVGDAAMAPEELYSETGNYRGPNNGLSGMQWLQLMKRHYKKIVWLNPKMAPGRAPWREAETAIKEMFPMYKLTVDGLKLAMNQLMV